MPPADTSPARPTWGRRPEDETDSPRSAGPTAHRSEFPRVGEVLGKYRLTAVLGQGSSARVFRGEHLRLPLAVAVKVLTPENATSPDVLERLGREAAVLAGLNHPNIVRLWDFDDAGPFPFIATEFVEGRTLADAIARCGRLTPDWAAHLAGEAVAGLAAAHQTGIIHRDVKPANVLIAKDGRVKLADLGLALVRRTAAPDTIAADRRTPTTTGLSGTPAYMAPEQARDPEGIDHRADMYALGATLYHALTGRPPFTGRSPAEVILRHVTERPVPPRSIHPAIPEAMSALVLRLLAKSPADRPVTYAELADALRSLAD